MWGRALRRWTIAVVSGLALAATSALAATPRLGVYRCGAERQVVSRCDEFCEVDYPDRPERNGFQVQGAENAERLAARLVACKLIANLDGTPVMTSPAPASRTATAAMRVRAGATAAGTTAATSSTACRSVTGCSALPDGGRRPRSPVPGYTRTQQVPGYDHTQGQPGYDHPQTTPGYDHPQTVPGY